MLQRLGFWKVMTHSHRSKNTTHQCGTLCFGTDPRASVLDPYCRTHDVDESVRRRCVVLSRRRRP